MSRVLELFGIGDWGIRRNGERVMAYTLLVVSLTNIAK